MIFINRIFTIMANWATTKHFVYGNVEKLNKLHDVLVNIVNSDDDWAGNILPYYNSEYDESSEVSVRCSIEKVGKQRKDGSFCFESTDACEYCELWDMIFGLIKNDDNDVFHCWKSTENGCGVKQLHNEGVQEHFHGKDYISYNDCVWRILKWESLFGAPIEIHVLCEYSQLKHEGYDDNEIVRYY